MVDETILLTGATGFLGSHLLGQFLDSGFRVVIAKRSFSKTGRIDGFLGKCNVYDIDKTGLEPIFEQNKISIVIHTATTYGRRGEKLSEMLESNIMFPLKLLELSIAHGATAYVNTDTVLPPTTDNYVSTKKQFVDYASQMCDGRMRFVNMKLEHMYGPGDDNVKFIQFIIESMLAEKKSIDLTKGEQMRGFVHVRDVVSAYMVVLGNIGNMEKGINSFEVGSGKSYSIRDVVQMAAEISKSKTSLRFGALDYRKNEAMDSKVDITPLARLGWKPKIQLMDGLAETIEWTRQSMKGD